MAFTVRFYENNKRENSTKLPTNGSEALCNIKETCGILSPSISLSSDNPTRYNYAYIPKFNRYYFIKDWVYSRGLWESSLFVDVLASYRAAIIGSSQYVLRSSAESDENIIDTKYPAKGGAKKGGEVTGYLPGFPALPGEIISGGTFIVGIVAPMPWLSASVNPSGLQYIAMTVQNFTAMMNVLLDSKSESYTDFWQDTMKATFNPFQYIVSVKWFPVTVPNDPLANPPASLKLGWFTFPGVTYYMPIPSKSYNTTLDELPDHPQIMRGKYLNKSPYRQIYCYLPGAGTISLDSDMYAAATIRCDLDFLTGQARYYVFCNDTQIASVDCEIGVSVPISQITVNGGKAILNGIGAVAGIAASAAMGNISGVIGGVTSGIGNAIDTIAPQAQSMGTQGSRAIFTMNPLIRIWSIIREIVEEDNDDLGRPLCKKKVLSSVPGYCLVSDADIALPSTADEQKMVKNYMEGGFFIE